MPMKLSEVLLGELNIDQELETAKPEQQSNMKQRHWLVGMLRGEGIQIPTQPEQRSLLFAAQYMSGHLALCLFMYLFASHWGKHFWKIWLPLAVIYLIIIYPQGLKYERESHKPEATNRDEQQRTTERWKPRRPENEDT